MRRALRELGLSWDIVTGTSIGAVNGALMVQGDFHRAYELWSSIGVEDVIRNGLNLSLDPNYYFENWEAVVPFLKSYLEHKGADITPFLNLLDQVLDEKRFFASPVDYGLITVEVQNLLPREVLKRDMNPGQLKSWVVASSACFPAFPMAQVEGRDFIDGGYFDNLPIDTAFRLGADQVVAVGLNPGVSKKRYVNSPLVRFIEPHEELAGILSFDRPSLDRSLQLGYHDAMKAFGRLWGKKYTFSLPDGARWRGFWQKALRTLLRAELGARLPKKNLAARFESSAPAAETVTALTGAGGRDALAGFLEVLELCMELFAWDTLPLYTLPDILRRLDTVRPQGDAGKLWDRVTALRDQLLSDAPPIQALGRESGQVLSAALLLAAFRQEKP